MRLHDLSHISWRAAEPRLKPRPLCSHVPLSVPTMPHHQHIVKKEQPMLTELEPCLRHLLSIIPVTLLNPPNHPRKQVLFCRDNYSPHFSNQETKAQGRWVTCTITMQEAGTENTGRLAAEQTSWPAVQGWMESGFPVLLLPLFVQLCRNTWDLRASTSSYEQWRQYDAAVTPRAG